MNADQPEFSALDVEVLPALEAFCEASFKCSTLEGVKSLYQASSELGKDYPFLAGAVQSHLFMVKEGILNSASVKVGGHVYAVEYSNGLVKIGKTMNPQQRMATLKSMSSSSVVRHFMSARTIEPHRFESLAHRHFKSRRKHGEFFAIPMNEAVAFISQKINQIA